MITTVLVVGGLLLGGRAVAKKVVAAAKTRKEREAARLQGALAKANDIMQTNGLPGSVSLGASGSKPVVFVQLDVDGEDLYGAAQAFPAVINGVRVVVI
jgi:hypothetical protein